MIRFRNDTSSLWQRSSARLEVGSPLMVFLPHARYIRYQYPHTWHHFGCWSTKRQIMSHLTFPMTAAWKYEHVSSMSLQSGHPVNAGCSHCQVYIMLSLHSFRNIEQSIGIKCGLYRKFLHLRWVVAIPALVLFHCSTVTVINYLKPTTVAGMWKDWIAYSALASSPKIIIIKLFEWWNSSFNSGGD